MSLILFSFACTYSNLRGLQQFYFVAQATGKSTGRRAGTPPPTYSKRISGITARHQSK
jgi:hypothetical protein